MEDNDPFSFLDKHVAPVQEQAPRQALREPVTTSAADDDFAFLDKTPPPQSPAPTIIPAKPGIGTALEAFGSNYLDTPTMGGATALRAGIGSIIHGKTYPEEYQRIKAKQDAAKAASPTAANVGTTLGVAAGFTPMGRVGTILSRLPGAVGAGAVSGAASSYGETGKAEDAAVSAALGGLGGAGGNLIGRMLSPVITATGRRLGVISPAAATRTAEELRREAKGLYDAAKQMGVVVNPASINALRNDVLSNLRSTTGYTPNSSAYPKVRDILRDLEHMALPGPSGQSRVINFDELEAIRQRVNKTMLSDVDKSTRQMGYSIRGQVDNFFNNIGQHSIHPDASVAANFVSKARPLWLQASKADDISDALSRAQRRTQSTYSGGNLDNATRQEMRRVLEKEIKYSSNRYTPEELGQLQTAIEGTTLGNQMRRYGKVFAPSGIKGLGEAGLAATGLLTGQPLLPALALGAAGTGALAKHVSERMTDAEVRELQRMIASTGRREVPSVMGQPISELTGRIGTIIGAPSLNEMLPPVNRKQRASGGRADKRDYPAKRMTNLEKLARRAHHEIARELLPVMQCSDDAVADALRLAK